METYELDGWGVLGDRTRRTIVERLADHARTVGELAADLPVSRPAVSQHLKVLKDAGLVVDQPVGNRRIYRVNRHIDRHGEGWQGISDGVGGEGGWPLYLQRFARLLDRDEDR